MIRAIAPFVQCSSRKQSKNDQTKHTKTLRRAISRSDTIYLYFGTTIDRLNRSRFCRRNEIGQDINAQINKSKRKMKDEDKRKREKKKKKLRKLITIGRRIYGLRVCVSIDFEQTNHSN